MTPTPNRRRYRTGSAILALALAIAPAAAPVLATMAPVAAEARPGLGGSFGSRGSRTYMAPPATRTDPGGASPFDRSLTPRPGGYGQYGNAYGGYGGALSRPHPFLSGFGGGLLGVGLAGLLFGHGGYGYGGGGMGLGGLLGLLIQLGILFFVVRWLWRRFAGAGRTTGGTVMPMTGAAAARGPAQSASLTISTADYNQFEQLLRDVQQAWSMQDLRSLSRFATPEMVSYFSEQLAGLSSRSLRNAVTDVRLEQGDLAEAWNEGGREYATVAMRYSMVDVTTDLSGRVVDGSPNERQMVTELWTFLRARGGSWILSAIQQAR